MEAMIENRKEERMFWAGMKRRILKFVIVNAVLVLINGLACPHYWWVSWVLLGWGAGLLLHLVLHYIDRTGR